MGRNVEKESTREGIAVCGNRRVMLYRILSVEVRLSGTWKSVSNRWNNRYVNLEDRHKEKDQ